MSKTERSEAWSLRWFGAGGWVLLGAMGAGGVAAMMHAVPRPEQPAMAWLALAPWGMLGGSLIRLYKLPRSKILRIALTTIGGMIVAGAVPLLLKAPPLLTLLGANAGAAAALTIAHRNREKPVGGLECGLMSAALALLGYDLLGWLAWPLAGILAAAAYLKLQKKC